MKIAQVCPYDFSRPGGVKSHITSLSKYLTKLGHEVKIVAPNIHSEKINDPQVHFFGQNRNLNFGGTKIDINLVSGRELKDLKRFLNAENFDIIHYHTIWNPLLPFQVRLHSKAKHVATFHDTPKSKLIGKTFMPLAAATLFPFLDQVISVSATQRKFISRFSRKKIHIIPNGIDLEVWPETTPTLPEYQDGKFNLLFLGRLEPRKGLIYALEVFKQLKPRYPELRLIIAGDGDERSLAETFIEKHNLDDVELLGFVDEEKKRQLLKTTDIYLAPAIYGESFGIVLLEAMAMGTPMAGFANEGYKNVLTEEMLPFFPEPKDLNGLTEAVDSLVMDASLREKLAKIGHKEVKSYDWKLIAEQIVTLYGEVMGKKI